MVGNFMMDLECVCKRIFSFKQCFIIIFKSLFLCGGGHDFRPEGWFPNFSSLSLFLFTSLGSAYCHVSLYHRVPYLFSRLLTLVPQIYPKRKKKHLTTTATISCLLRVQATQPVPFSKHHSGVYYIFFITPKRNWFWRAIVRLKYENRYVIQKHFHIETQKLYSPWPSGFPLTSQKSLCTFPCFQDIVDFSTLPTAGGISSSVLAPLVWHWVFRFFSKVLISLVTLICQ